ncbi:ankyrin repeat domain-containing protein [Leptospira borgpetersenii]|uniref:ankyrin repeat domain-containing protein n=2 Tax=Leptospira borgpetersenii TaxID=174 RepID=UPI00077341D7|nr:ankyrin repeat domain-containing protein [Leptospira borgpetersenii]MBE8400817.1 ankyrin repeat domain-containing protein [Leptospira borgpetersenii serovar Tarassovi]MBE8403958.1 ankyrin repeat domain-containing protein [Leptospira borgpetersenii serovar Tarassovi]MBE8406956.1 ankyrin repeat domain-containing protein [Leptospira borgpetersenii serovar Tarassovi]MBE8413339.1 ankyrin repeat domain-containing protein [Leptospira borgpetersenii serovar Tarassovi]MBE8417409.1 ankyrin repeat dom
MESNLLNSRLLKEADQYQPNLQKIQSYLEQGADINCRSGQTGGRDNWGNTPLHIAVNEEQSSLIDFLLDRGADIHSKNMEGYTPVFKIPWGRKEGLEILQLLQKRGANLQDTSNTKDSLLHYAALNDNVPVIQYLLQNNVDPNSLTEEQETPLHWASRENCVKSAKILLAVGCEVNLQNAEGRTALHEAAEQNFQELIQVLLEYGADTEITDENGDKPIDLTEKKTTKNLLAGKPISNEDPQLQLLIRNFLFEQKESFGSLRKKIQENLHKTLSKIDRKSLIQSVSKSLPILKTKWQTSFPNVTTILLEWAGNTQSPFSGYAYARGYKQFEIIDNGRVNFENEHLKFEDFENGIDFTEAFQGIDSILESCNSKEYPIVQKIYNSFLIVLLNEVFSDTFRAESESDDYWSIFGSEHDQDPFLIFNVK